MFHPREVERETKEAGSTAGRQCRSTRNLNSSRRVIAILTRDLTSGRLRAIKSQAKSARCIALSASGRYTLRNVLLASTDVTARRFKVPQNFPGMQKLLTQCVRVVPNLLKLREQFVVQYYRSTKCAGNFQNRKLYKGKIIQGSFYLLYDPCCKFRIIYYFQIQNGRDVYAQEGNV